MSGFCKYYKQKKQVSYDSGTTWQDVVPAEYQKGELYETNSTDCGYVGNFERWVQSGTSCNGTSLYYLEVYQISDDGVNWVTTDQVRFGDLIEQYSSDCGYCRETGYTVTLNDSRKFYWCCDGTGTFPAMYYFSDENAKFHWSAVTDAVIEDCNTSIPGGAFHSCTSLTSVTIPNSITTIGPHAFNQCTIISGVTVPDSVTSIGSGCFADCYNLKNFTVPSGLTEIKELTFVTCKSLSSITLSNVLTTIGNYAFHGCSSLTSINIPNSVTSIGIWAFESCSGLTSINIPNSVTTIGDESFSNCTSLTGATIGSGIKTLENGIFYNCTNLRNANLSEGLLYIKQSAFENCYSLSGITIPTSVTYIGGLALGNCSGLTYISLNSVVPPTLQNEYVFDNTNNCPIYVPCNLVNTYKSATYWSAYASRIQASPNTVVSARTVSTATTCVGYDKYAVDEYQVSCDGSSWSTVSSTTGSLIEAYSSDCGYVPYYKVLLDINDGTQRVVACNDSTTLTSEEVHPEGGYRQYHFTNVIIGDCVTTIGSSAFHNQIVDNIKIPSGVTRIADWAFTQCGISAITIPNSITSIGDYAFSGSSLTSVTIPDSVTSIGSESFRGCNSLINATIGSGSIGSNAFYNCSNLTNVTIGSGIAVINSGAFQYCSNLSSITINATTPPILGNNALGSIYNEWPIYVPCDSVAAYKAASGWSDYASRIQCRAKFSATYSDSTAYSVECDSSTTLTSSETRPSGYASSTMTSAVIGSCVTEVGNSAFAYYFTSLSSVTIPDSVTSIDTSAFYGCHSLPATNNVRYAGDKFAVEAADKTLSTYTLKSGTKWIGNSAFYRCSGLTSITIPSSVIEIGQIAFRYCSGLSSITIPYGVTSIGDYAFRDCSGLTSITVNAATPPTLAYGSAFRNTNNCPIYVPCGSVDSYKAAWSDYVDRIQCIGDCGTNNKFEATYSGGTTYSAACDSSTNLTTATTRPSGYQVKAMTTAKIGDCITSIGVQAFSGCTRLESVCIPNSVTSIYGSAFRDCSRLSSISLPSGLTSIGEYAFTTCSNLTNIDIPNSVTSIGDDAFRYCTSLTSITINAIEPPTLGSNALYNTNNCTIYVPASAVNDYMVASGWSDYASRIQAIPT